MAIAFGAAGTLGAAASGTSIAPALPAGLVVGNLMVGFVSTKNNATHTWPAGWTKVNQTNSGALFTTSWAWRIFRTGDTAPSVTWTGSVANTGQIWSYTGQDVLNPIGAVGTVATGTTTPHTSTAITTTRNNSFTIYIDACSANTVLTAPAGYTQNVGNGSATSVTANAAGSKTVSTTGTSTGAISTTGGAAAWTQAQVEILAPMPPDPDQQLIDLQDPHLKLGNQDRLDRFWNNQNLFETLYYSLVQPPDTSKIFRGHLRSLPDQPAPSNAFQSWTWQYNLNLIGNDRLPIGEQVWERPTLPIPPPALTWTASGTFPPMVAGSTLGVTLRPIWRSLPDQPAQPLQQQSAFQSYPPLYTPPTVVTLPPGLGPALQTDWPNPQQPWRLEQTWTRSYNLNLIGQDRLPVGEQIWERPTLPIPPPLTWIQTVAYEEISKPFAQYDWPNATLPYRIEQTSAASYNLNLIGQDKLPTGEQITDLPPRDFVRLLQTWIQQTNLALLTAPPNIFAQARQQDWPVPRGAEPDWRRSWEFSYNKNLLGQDQLPIRQQDWPNPIPPLLVKDWIQQTNLALLAQPPALLPYRRSYTDLPVPAPQQPAQSWTFSYNLNLIGKDQLPIGAELYELAPSQKPPEQVQLHSWAWCYDLNLIGQDELPFRQQDWPLTPAAQRAVDLATWVDRVKWWLLKPFAQLDWPNPTQPFRDPTLATVARGYNLDLLGQDQLPNRQQDWPLPQTAEYTLLRAFILSLNIPLLAPPTLVPPLFLRNQDWPNPTAPAYPNNLRAWPIQGSPAPIIPGVPPPPVTGPAVYNKPMLAGPGYLNVIPGEKPS
jgi:hypothetical protein